jgi:hypothetical protein
METMSNDTLSRAGHLAKLIPGTTKEHYNLAIIL